MAKKKVVPFARWQTCKTDGVEKRYIRLSNSQLLHEATMSLSDKAFRIYTMMLLESGGCQEFEFPYSRFKQLASKQGFLNARTELIKRGFIEIVHNNSNLRLPNVYKFSEKWKTIPIEKKSPAHDADHLNKK